MSSPVQRSEPQRATFLVGALLLIQLAILLISVILLPYRIARVVSAMRADKPQRREPRSETHAREQKVLSEAPQ